MSKRSYPVALVLLLAAILMYTPRGYSGRLCP